MQLKAVSATNSRGSTLDLPLEDISGGFIVKDIQGLGPVGATLVSSSFANMDGEQFHSSKRQKRNLVIQLGLEPDYAMMSVQQLRSQLYEFFMPKTRVLLNFQAFNKFEPNILNQLVDLEIEGIIETCEPDIFTREPTLNVSIVCFDPDFVDPDLVIFAGMSTSGLNETVVPYAGNIETGVVFEFKPDRVITDFSIYHRPEDNTLNFVEFSYPLLANEVVRIVSIFGEKKVTLTRGGVESSILYALSPQSAWLELQPGNNNLRVYATGAAIPYDVEYTTKYGGL